MMGVMQQSETTMTQDQVKELIRVVDDDSNVRRSWQFVLEGEGWAVKTYASATDFLREDDPRIAGCVLLDVRMPEMSGLELQRHMKRAKNRLPIVFLSAHGDIDMAVKCVKDGAHDFLSKPVQTDRLIEVVGQAVAKDHAQRRERQEFESLRAAFASLSAREQEVARGVSQGLLNKQIAFDLNITEKTVIAHRSSLCKKLGIKTGAEITRILLLLDLYERKNRQDD